MTRQLVHQYTRHPAHGVELVWKGGYPKPIQKGTRITMKNWHGLFPKSNEIPRVSQFQLRRLYIEFVNGIENEELLSEVESRILARAEVFFDLNAIRRSFLMTHGTEPVVLTDERTVDISAVPEKELYEKLDELHILESDSPEIWHSPYERMLVARGKSYRRRMVVLDEFISTAHAYGPMASTWIEDTPQEAYRFLYTLSRTRGLGMMPGDMFIATALGGAGREEF